jgi:hypothetical protein
LLLWSYHRLTLLVALDLLLHFCVSPTMTVAQRHPDDAPHWKLLQKVEASMHGGKIDCQSSAVFWICPLVGDQITVYGTVAVEEWTGSPKRFRVAYNGTTKGGKPCHGVADLPDDHWRINTLKAKSYNAKARLLLMRFSNGGIHEMQLTFPIESHKDSKHSKAVVKSIVVYGSHFISHKTIRVGKQAMTDA